jgi:ABC-type sulfate transport system substrate-binding protein
MRRSHPHTRLLSALVLPAALVAAGTLGATAASAATPRADTVNVVGYSIVAGAYTALESAFQATPAGAGVVFNNSFGPSTTQADDVVAGQPADVVNFSTSPDLQLLVTSGLVSPTWATKGAGKVERGFVSDSYVVLVTQPSNPLGITGWPSLTKPGVKIVTPDPISSGSARWNLLGAYESQILAKRTPKQAATYTNALVKNVVAEPSSGSKALTAFLAGTGNVLLAYEADALAAKASGKAINIVYPARNILIQTPAALTSSGSTNRGAKKFFAFLFSPAGQNVWAHNGFRPTLPSAAKVDSGGFAHRYAAKQLSTIASLGGWNAVTFKFFSPNGIITDIEKAHGWTS